MLRSGIFEPIIRHRVVRKGGESVVRPLDVVEEDSIILVLHDGLDLFLGGFLLDTLDGKVVFAWDVVLVLPLVDPVDIVVPTLAPAPAPALLPGRMFDFVPPATPTSALVPAADGATLGTASTVELVQCVGRDASMKHNAIPDVLRPLSRLRARGIDEGGTAGPLVCELPGAGDRRVAAWWWAVKW